MQYRTGDTAAHRGVYHSNCKCSEERVVRPGERLPTCPTCERPVTWLYTRSPSREEAQRPGTLSDERPTST